MPTMLKEYRLKTDIMDDTDFVGTQAVPPDLLTFASPYRLGAAALNGGLELWLEWIDAADSRVAGAGSVTLETIPVHAHPITGDPTVVGDSQAFVATQAYRPIFVSTFQHGDQVGVRLTNITPPMGTTQVRILFREVPV